MSIISCCLFTLLFLTNSINSQTLPLGHSPKLGYVFDGFPIYGLYTDGGVYPTDLDICNGRNHSSLGYLYHLTETLPYTIGCYRGETFCNTGMPGMSIPGCVNTIPQSGSTIELTCASLGLLSGYSPRAVPYTINATNIPTNDRCTVQNCSIQSAYCFDTDSSVPTNLLSSVTCRAEGDQLIISSNGIPNHVIGLFPLSAATSLNNYNMPMRKDSPNLVSEQNYNWRIPRYPTSKSTVPTENVVMNSSVLTLGPIAFAINGVPFFNIYNSMVEDAVSPTSNGFEVLDLCVGHAQQFGGYHYHAIPYCLINSINGVSNTIQCSSTSAASRPVLFPMFYTIIALLLIFA